MSSKRQPSYYQFTLFTSVPRDWLSSLRLFAREPVILLTSYSWLSGLPSSLPQLSIVESNVTCRFTRLAHPKLQVCHWLPVRESVTFLCTCNRDDSTSVAMFALPREDLKISLEAIKKARSAALAVGSPERL